MTDAVARLRRFATVQPHAVLLTTRGRVYTYAETLRRARAVGAALRAAGGERGRRVALYLEEYDQFFVCLLGAWLAGTVVVPLNTSLPRADADWLIAKAAPDVLVLPSDDACPGDGQARLVVTADEGGLVDGLRPAGETASAGGAAAPAPGPAGLSEAEAVRADEQAMIMFTSGTTGLPKGVCQTLRAISSNAGHVALELGLGETDRIFINTPPYFTSGICHFLTLLAAGGGVAGQLGFFFGAGLLDEMETLGCTGFGGAPAHLVRVVEPLEEPREHAFRFWVSSGDHLPLPVIEKLRRVLPGVALFNMYGLTEVSGRLCILPPAELDVRVGSVGRPIGDMRVAARRGDGAEAAPGETGELHVTGSLLMQGYLDEPDITAKTLTAHGLKTGDFGHVDATGAVWIAGRKDDIIKRGGEKVSIIHVQQALQGLGRFADVAVLAAPDDILGHVPVAFVVPLEPDGFKASKLLRELRGVLPSTSLPSRIISVPSIPRTGSGKAVQRRAPGTAREGARVKGFGAGFRNRNPLVLLVAAALLIPALLGFEYLFTSGAWSLVPLKYCLRNASDSFTYVSWTVGHNKITPPQTPAVYLTGGSAAREAIVSGPGLAAEVRRSGGPRIAAWDLACINQNFAETLAVADNVPTVEPAWVLIGVNLGRFTAYPAQNEQQVIGRDLILKSSFLQKYVSATYGRYTYSYTILPGIFSYLTSYLKKDGPALLEARLTAREYKQHHYSQEGIHTPGQKERMVTKWNATRFPVFRKNLEYNLAMLEQLVIRCEQRGVQAVIVELPLNEAAVKGRFDKAIAQYRTPVRAMATARDVPYLDFNADAHIPSADFHDLSHLVEPGRVVWQKQLARELARLLRQSAGAESGAL